ncbi:MAG: 23S rRNA (pseudouridine(1915)-N(3))-methyltransferase RlmH [Bacteroidales bacterium]|nr:23S rRNA (pseudouridine(1915)-N(3))-methyltransferase RlmH [Bacteroidales bacterium]MBQ4298713.1 23S rRNA (pseudouridine(1915)-N(3))-methyltransferase RlmH [Bacteroidales bacterium]
MELMLLTVGKTDVDWVKEGLDLYVSRLKHYVPFRLEEIPQLKGVGALSPGQIKQKEGELILKRVPAGARLILLDEHGREFRSMDFASWIETQLSTGGKNLCFAVGGAYGFSDEVRSRAQGSISLSKMTFSHQMVRVLFAEQLYRAFTILNGEPYHNE